MFSGLNRDDYMYSLWESSILILSKKGEVNTDGVCKNENLGYHSLALYLHCWRSCRPRCCHPKVELDERVYIRA